MKTYTEQQLLAFANDGFTHCVKLWYEDKRFFRNKVVPLESDEFFDEIENREHTYHVAYEYDYSTIDNYHIIFNCFENAYDFFKEELKKYHFTEVKISTELNNYNPNKWLEEKPMTREEEYEEACFAESCGEPLLMQRYNERYHIEEEYSPSAPWNAPGMSVRDFI